ncbi:MAG: hypothetical protein RI973_1703 [Bacteroidota bacterium]
MGKDNNFFEGGFIMSKVLAPEDSVSSRFIHKQIDTHGHK